MEKNALTWPEKISRFRRLTIGLVLALIAVSVPAPNSPFISSAQAGYGTGGCELSGLGTELTPYLIDDAVDLWEVIDCNANPGEVHHFRITTNIEVGGAGYQAYMANPIGVRDGFSPNSAINAVIDGDEHEITYSMTVTQAEGGLFYKLENVTISDLVLRGSLTSTGTTTELDAQGSLAAIAKNSSFIRIANHVAISSSGELAVGGLVGYVDNNMHVENVSNYGQLSGQGYVGGLFGKAAGGVMEVSSFSNYADVTALDYGAAGAIGILTSTATANFTNVSNYGEISVTSAEGEGSGGLIAFVEIESQVSFDSVRNLGTVSAPVRYVGGIIGSLLSGTSSISNSVNEGRVTSGGWVGGIVGNLEATLSMTSVVNSGAVSVSPGLRRNTGGLVGYSQGALSLVSVSNQALIGGGNFTGGLVGQHESSSLAILSITGSQNTGEVSGQEKVGGMVGFISGSGVVATFANSENLGTVSSTAGYLGGIIGVTQNAVTISMTSVANTGPVSSPSTNIFVGGIIGSAGDSANLSLVLSLVSVSNQAQIEGGDRTGGLIGRYAGAGLEISASQNIGGVSGSNEVGGLVGTQEGTGISTFSAVANSGQITGSESVGGLVGLVDTDSYFENSENLGTVSAAADYAGGIVGYGSNSRDFRFESVSNRGQVSGGDKYNGGIFGALEGSVSLTSVTNFATVTGLSHSCGGLGGYAQLGQLSISQSSNIGEVGCTHRAGGLVGRVAADSPVSVYRSSNHASISASAGDAGGILGFLKDGNGKIEILESFNTGNISGSNHSAGLVGNATDRDYQITRSYSVGLISGGTTSGLVGSDMAAAGFTSIAESYVGESSGQPTFNDGLVTAASSTVLVSVYTFANSSLTQSVTVAELKVASTYVDWNFETVWGFGGCDLNNGYPVLRWANEGATLYDYSCGVMSSSSPVVAPGNTPGNTPATNPAPFSYQGPLLESHQVTVVVKEVVVVKGLRLESILEASVGGKVAQINQLTSTSIAITIPELEPGAFDLVVQGSHGVLTVSLKFKVVEPSKQVASSSVAIAFGDLLGFRWVSKFDGNSRDLTEQQVVLVSTALGVFTNATTIVCWGYTKDPAPNDWALAHATKRAASLCNEVTALRDDVRVFVRVQLGVNRYAAMRATMQFWESKGPQ